MQMYGKESYNVSGYARQNRGDITIISPRSGEDNMDTDYLVRSINTDILANLITIGTSLAQGVPNSDPRLQELDMRNRLITKRILESSQGIRARVDLYHILGGEFVRTQRSQPQLIDFVSQIFRPVFTRRDALVADIQKHGAGLIVATHKTRTAETDLIDLEGMPMQKGELALGASIVTRVGLDTALEGTTISVARLVGESPTSNLYNETMLSLGNVPFRNDGTDKVADQVKSIVANGQVPLISPEGGFRALAEWHTGAIVLAVKAGLRNLYLVPHSPLVSLLAPEMTFDYVGRHAIPLEVIDAVACGDTATVKEFSHKIRAAMATGIQGLPYPSVYKQCTSQYTTA